MTPVQTKTPIIRRLALLGLIVVVMLAGCRAPATTPDAQSQSPGSSQVHIQPIEPRIDVIAGLRVLVPIRLEPPITPIGAVELKVALDGADEIDAELLWISRTPPEPPLTTDPISAWIEAPPDWAAHSVEQLIAGELPPGDGFWSLLIDLPQGAHNRRLFIGGRSAPVQWLNPRLGQHDAGSTLFSKQSPELARALTNAGRDPLNRWRTRLLDDRLRAPRRSVIETHATLFEHKAIETMAQQAEWRWRLALDRLSQIDPFLGAELFDRLTAVARFDEQTQAPVWPTDDAALTALRTALLSPELADESKIALTRDTLRRFPATTAWIIDDAGWVEPTTGRTIVLLGVAERLGRAGLVRGSIGGRTGPTAPLSAFGVARATVLAPTFPPGGAPALTPAILDVIGQDAIELPTLPLGLPVEPPGFRLGPGLAPWTLKNWSAGAPQPALHRLSFYALIHRRASVSTDSTTTGSAWQLHVECPIPPDSDPDSNIGMLRIHLGPSNAPIASLRIDPAGLLTDEIGSPLGREGVAIRKTPSAWIATIDIPTRAIESDGILRLAIERFDGVGGRATWPRPVLPWQTSPGRAALDLNAWNSLTPIDGD